MASAKKCDKCKAFYDPYRGIRYRADGEIYSAFTVALSNGFKLKAFDLCPACMKEAITFLGLEPIVERSEEE